MGTLAFVTAGMALGDVDHGVREEGGNNQGERIRTYLRYCDPPINVAAPWCAAAVQYWSDQSAEALAVPNPLNTVRLEAYVQSYYDWAKAEKRIIDVANAYTGDLILYRFGQERWDHIGVVLRPLHAGKIAAIEGNTSPGVGATAEERERDGDGVFVKVRTIGRQPIAIIRWAA